MKRVNGKTMRKGIIYVFCLILTSCAAIAPPPARPPAAAPEAGRESPGEKPRPRELASFHLTERGRMLLESGKVDDAITVLERAVSISASNGKNYYYLAEAWMMKGNVSQAKEWNRLAERYLAGDREWSQRVYWQRERIKSHGR